MSAVKRPKALIKAKQCKNNTASSSKQGVRLGRLQRIFTAKNRPRYQVQRCHQGLRGPFYCQMAEKRRHREHNTFLSAYRQLLLLPAIVINRNGFSMIFRCSMIFPQSVAYQRLSSRWRRFRTVCRGGLLCRGWTVLDMDMVCLQPNASPHPKACQG